MIVDQGYGEPALQGAACSACCLGGRSLWTSLADLGLQGRGSSSALTLKPTLKTRGEAGRAELARRALSGLRGRVGFPAMLGPCWFPTHYLNPTLVRLLPGSGDRPRADGARMTWGVRYCLTHKRTRRQGDPAKGVGVQEVGKKRIGHFLGQLHWERHHQDSRLLVR